MTIERILEKAQDYPKVWDYLPARRDCYRLSRQFLLNVINTIVGAPFSTWVTEQIKARDLKVADKGNMWIEMDAEVAAAFRASTAVSSKKDYFSTNTLLIHMFALCVVVQHGRSSHMLKIGSKRRRTQAEIEDAKAEEEAK